VLNIAGSLAITWGNSDATCFPAFGPQLQQEVFFSVSLKNGKGWATLGAPKAQGQHSTLGTQLGFSQTNSHFGLGQLGLWHFQSHFGSSQTGSHSGFGACYLQII